MRPVVRLRPRYVQLYAVSYIIVAVVQTVSRACEGKNILGCPARAYNIIMLASSQKRQRQRQNGRERKREGEREMREIEMREIERCEREREREREIETCVCVCV